MGRLPIGLRTIVVYKLAKSVLQIVIACALVFFGAGAQAELRAWASAFQRHGTAAWSGALASALMRAAKERSVHAVSLALCLDAILGFVEAWALARRFAWGPWLVLVSAGSLMPFEVVETVRDPHLGRVLLLAINVLIVLYLGRRIALERRDART